MAYLAECPRRAATREREAVAAPASSMSQEVNPKSTSRRFAPAGVAFAVVGAALFAYFVWRAGPSEIWANISKMGAGFALVLVLSGARFAVRAWAWTLCFEAPHRLSVWEAFKAHLIGDTAGNIISLGMVVSEPTKAAMVRERVPLLSAVAALAVENLFYMLSVVVFLFCGAATLLLVFPLTKLLWWLSVGILAGVVVAVAVASWAVRRQLRFLTAALSWANRRGLGRGSFERRHARAAALEEKVYGFHTRHRARFVPILLLQSSFHLLGVAEAYLTIHLISDVPPTLLTAFLFETVNRIINIVFKYIPLRAGVDEAGTGALAVVLKFGVNAGVTLAIVRKARMVFWMSIGIILLVSRGLSLRAVAAEAERAQQAVTNESLESGV